MNRSETIALIERIYAEAFNGHNPAALDDLFADDFVAYAPGYGGPLDRAGARWAVADYIRAFPDAHWEVEGIMVEGDQVAWRETFTGTHGQPLHGMPPTGRVVRATGMSMALLRAGRVWRHWSVYDSLGILQQIGLMPPLADD